MSETSAPPPAPPSAAAAHRPARREGRVIVRPWPKVIFFYPTFVCALVAWFWSLLRGDVGSSTGVGGLGAAFLLVFFLNLMVFSFDFSRIKSITIVLGVIAVVLGLAWANTKWEVVSGLSSALDKIDIRMNTQFYGFVSASFAVIYILVLINTRFNYYEINTREILHHHGYLGDITRMPTSGLRLNKEIYDLMEYLLLRSGRLIFYTMTSRDAIVIDNVIGVNDIENRIKDLLSVVAVRAVDEHETFTEME